MINILSFRPCFASRFSRKKVNKLVIQTRYLTIVVFKISFFQYFSSIDIWFTGIQCKHMWCLGGNYNFFIGFKPSTSNHWAIAAQVEIFEYLLLYLGSNQIHYSNDALITELKKLLLRWLYLEIKIKIVILLIFLSLLVYRHNLSKDYH